MDWLSPTLGLVGSTFSGFMANRAAKTQANAMLEATRMTNEANERMQRETNEWNRNLWLEQSAYNTPAKQAERYEAAGINPYMALSNISSGEASSAPQMEAPRYENPSEAYAIKANADIELGKQLSSAASQAAAMYSTAKLQSAEADKAKSEAALNTIDAMTRAAQNEQVLEHSKGQNYYQSLLNYLTYNTMDSSISGAKADADYKEQLFRRQHMENVVYESTGLRLARNQIHFLEAQIEVFSQDAKLKEMMAKGEEEQARLYVEKQLTERSNRALNSAQIGLYGSQSSYYKSQKSYVDEQKEGQRLSNVEAKRLAPFVIINAVLENMSARQHVTQQVQDYYNPFKYVGFGAGLSGSYRLGKGK